jgi:predicted adenine nucleotide alpha hydrolase (AANH) superfamily ATPase
MKKVLIHTCCANCLIYPLKVLKEEGFEVHSYFYNHIHPFTEFAKRLENVLGYTKKEGINCIVREEYKLIEFIENTVFREENRCFYCYNSRLEATARLAAKSGFDYFTTTLLYSKQQKHQEIKEISENLARRFSIKFFYQDFREGWKEGIEKSKELGLYRQQYCGCIYSEKERYLGKKERFKANNLNVE